ncbi:MAG: DUF3127 domain-containing protein [Candidatus Cryptobacteroides sp.]
MEIEGRLVMKLAVQSGRSAKGDWAKQEFVIEYQEGNFPTKACFSVWGADKVKDLDKYNIGDQIKVAFNISSREFNGKWYTDLRAWRISPAGQAYTAPAQGYAGTGQGYAAPAQTGPGYGSMPAQNQGYGNYGTQGGYNDVPAGFAPSYGQQGSYGQQAPAPSLDDMPGDDLPF